MAGEVRAIRTSKRVWAVVAILFGGVIFVLSQGGEASKEKGEKGRYELGGPVDINFLQSGDGDDDVLAEEEPATSTKPEEVTVPKPDPWAESRDPWRGGGARTQVEDPSERRAREARSGGVVIANRWKVDGDEAEKETSEGSSDRAAAAPYDREALRREMLARLEGYASTNGPSAAPPPAPSSSASRPLVRDRLRPGTLPSGSSIPARLETAISSDAEGIVRAVVTADVYDFYQREVVIPAESKLVGTVGRGGLDQDGGRVEIGWEEIVLPDGRRSTLPLGRGYNRDGSSGVEGRVKRHVWRTMGQALAISAISAGFGTGRGRSAAGDGALYEASSTMGRAAERLVEEGLKTKPTVYVPAGTEILVLLGEDFSFDDGDIG